MNDFIISDDFNDNSIDPNIWQTSESEATLEESNGQLRVLLANSTAGSNFGLLQSVDNASLDNRRFYVEIIKLARSTTNAQSYVALRRSADSTDYLIWIMEANILYARYAINGVTTEIRQIAYTEQENKTFRWLAFAEENGVVRWEYSSDGETWKVFGQVATPITTTDLYIEMGGGTYQSEINPGEIIFDNCCTQPFQLLGKEYLFKVYDPSDNYLTTWQDVVSLPSYTQQINLPSSEMTLRLARSPESYGEENDVAFDNVVKIYIKDYEQDSMQLFFQGRIVSYKPIFGTDEGVQVTLYSLGERLDNIIFREDEAVDQSQLTGTTQYTVNSNATIYAQSFIPDQTTLTSVDVYCRVDRPITATLSVHEDNSGEPATNAMTNGTVAKSLTSTTADYQKFTFTTSPTLVIGTTYWLVLTT